MISSALEGKLDHVNYEEHPIFGLAMPVECENVPSKVLNPRNTWKNKEAYDKKAQILADSFQKNFEKFEKQANDEITSGAPKAS